jgi:hypothetical protein
LPADAFAALPLAALPLAGAATAVSVRLMPQSGAKAREKATRLLKTARRKPMKFIKSFPGARFGFWAGAPRIVNERTTGEMGQLHDPEVEIACKPAEPVGRFRSNCREFPPPDRV